MPRFLDELRRKSEIPTPQAPTKPTKAPSVGFVGTISQGSGNSETGDGAHQQPISTADELEQAIRQAQDWRDLAAAQEARCLPEQFAQDQASAGEKIIYVTDLLADDREPDACPCCGKAAWWTKAGGERVCGVCHPDPKRHERRLPLFASTPERR